MEWVPEECHQKVRVMEHLSYEERQRIESVQPRNWGDLMKTFQYWKGVWGKDWNTITRTCRQDKREWIQAKRKFRLDIKRKFFTVSMVSQQNKLPREAAYARSLELGRWSLKFLPIQAILSFYDSLSRLFSLNVWSLSRRLKYSCPNSPFAEHAQEHIFKGIRNIFRYDWNQINLQKSAENV